MSSQKNPFVLLEDEEKIDNFLASSPTADSQNKKKNNNQQQPSKTVVPTAQYATSGSGRGTVRGSGHGSSPCISRSSSGNNFEGKYEGWNSNRPSKRGTNGYQGNNNGGGIGFRRNNGGYNGYYPNYGTTNGDRRNYRGDSAKVEGNNQQLENHGQNSGLDGGWVTVTGKHDHTDNRRIRNWNSSYGGGRNGYGEGNGKYRAQEGQYANGRERANDERSERSDGTNKSVAKEELGANGGNADDGNNGWVETNVPVTREESEEEKEARLAHEEALKRRAIEEEENRIVQEERLKRKAIEEEEERKKMTLVQYEKLLAEKRKALEATKASERKVSLDKDFESMQLVEKKREDGNFINQKNEKDALESKDSFGKDEKVHKAKIRQIPLDKVFHIPRTRRGSWNGGRGRDEATGRGGGGRGEGGIKGPESGTGRGQSEQTGNVNRAGAGRGGGQTDGLGRGHGQQVGSRGGYSRRRVPAIGDARQFPSLG